MNKTPFEQRDKNKFIVYHPSIPSYLIHSVQIHHTFQNEYYIQMQRYILAEENIKNILAQNNIKNNLAIELKINILNSIGTTIEELIFDCDVNSGDGGTIEMSWFNNTVMSVTFGYKGILRR